MENIKIKQCYPDQQQCQPAQSWYVHHLPHAYLKHEANSLCLQHTCSTTDSTHPTINSSRLTPFLLKEMNQ
jgi:hypothetical protein